MEKTCLRKKQEDTYSGTNHIQKLSMNNQEEDQHRKAIQAMGRKKKSECEEKNQGQ